MRVCVAADHPARWRSAPALRSQSSLPLFIVIIRAGFIIIAIHLIMTGRLMRVGCALKRKWTDWWRLPTASDNNDNEILIQARHQSHIQSGASGIMIIIMDWANKSAHSCEEARSFISLHSIIRSQMPIVSVSFSRRRNAADWRRARAQCHWRTALMI